jgi:hypothetical protein
LADKSLFLFNFDLNFLFDFFLLKVKKDPTNAIDQIFGTEQMKPIVTIEKQKQKQTTFDSVLIQLSTFTSIEFYKKEIVLHLNVFCKIISLLSMQNLLALNYAIQARV